MSQSLAFSLSHPSRPFQRPWSNDMPEETVNLIYYKSKTFRETVFRLGGIDHRFSGRTNTCGGAVG
jgi:hypothetical protein